MTHVYRFTVAASLALAAWQAQANSEVALLKNADRYRMSSENLQVEVQVSVLNSAGEVDKDRRYTVFAQSGRQSLVVMQSPAEKGQKVLMLKDGYWLLMPGTQRPLRITPMQKLLGDASTGDIATLNWSDDYTAKLVGEEPCAEDGALPTCLHLSLAANGKAVTYQRIELWIGKGRHEPVRADLYVNAEKLAKKAHFIVDNPRAPTAVKEMVLLDKLSNHKETRVKYLSSKQRTIPETWLNPMFLVKNPALD